MKKAKKIILIVLASLLVLVFVAGLVLDNIGVTYQLDEDVQIVKNEDYNVQLLEDEKYISIAKFNTDGSISDDDFKIMVISDIHLDHKQDLGNYTYSMIVRNIVNEQPDFVVFLGDNLTSALNKPRTKQLGQLMEDLGIYWTFVLGNHEHSADNPFSISRQRMVSILSKYEHCLINASTLKCSDGTEVWGAGNTVINICNSQGISQTLFMMDSGTDMSSEDIELYQDELTGIDENRQDDYIKDSQVQWYKETLNDILKENPNVKSTVFFHIPTKEFREAYELFSGESEVNPFNETIDYVSYESGEDGLIYGLRRETICHSGHRSGIFEACVQSNSTQLIFTGHDHANNYIMRYKGILIAAAQTAGYSSYNLWTKGISEELIQGYNVLTYQSDGSVSIETRINKDLWGEELHQRAQQLIAESRGHAFESKRDQY